MKTCLLHVTTFSANYLDFVNYCEGNPGTCRTSVTYDILKMNFAKIDFLNSIYVEPRKLQRCFQIPTLILVCSFI